MSGRPENRDTVPNIVFDMDADVAAMVSWGRALRAIGTSGCHVEPDALYVMGDAMVERAEKIRDDWNRLFDLTR